MALATFFALNGVVCGHAALRISAGRDASHFTLGLTRSYSTGLCASAVSRRSEYQALARRLNGVPLLATSTDAGRKVLTARSSIDGGESWQTHSIVERGPAAYSALVDLGRGVVGCLYETKRPKDAPTGRVAGDGASSRKAHNGRKEDDDVLRFVRLNVSHLVGLHGETPAHDEL